MHRTHERRDDHEKRVPLRAAVELSEGEPDDSFEADAVNLSRGGMLLRSACLPDPGARLRCSFEHPETGAVIEAEGEVVWAQLEGEASGEIGLAFTNLDPRTEMLIEQIIAAHSSPPPSPSQDAQPSAQLSPQLPVQSGARVTNLSLEGISEPLEAQMAELGANRAVFEQVLPLLKLGRAVQTDAPELAGRRGAIASVELRMVGHVPTLAVTVAFAQDAASDDAEFSFTSTDVPGALEQDADQAPHDTEPDLAAPSEDSSAGHSSAGHSASEHTATTVNARLAPNSAPNNAPGSTTATEFSASKAPDRSRPPRQLALQAVQADAPRMSARREPEREEPLPAALASQVGAEATPVPAKSAPARPSKTDPTSVFPLQHVEREGSELEDSGLEDSELDDALQARGPAWKPMVVRGLRAAYQASLALGRQVLRLSLVSKAAALPHVRLGLVRVRGALRALGRGVGPQLGAARRLVAAQLGKKRRRTTAGGAHEHEATSRHTATEKSGSLGRMLAIGVLTTLAAGLGVYALIPTTEPEATLHRPVDLSESEPAPVDMAFAPSETGGPAAMPAGAQPQLLPTGTMPTTGMPSAASVPKGSPFAVDVREAGKARARAAATAPMPATVSTTVTAPTTAPASGPSSALEKPPARGMRFGSANPPPRAQRFTLRMSKPIQSIEGVADVGGFTVTVNGSLSLDRAGPISASHTGVARAMVLNKGDRAELTIRFIEGKRPTYQVRADGSTLYVIIEDV